MIVIADTSPLSYLIRLGSSDLLQNFYGQVLVPSAVVTELKHPEAPAEVRAWASEPPAWLEEIRVTQLDASLSSELGAGEREAISLALRVGANLLLIDDRAGRQAAEARKIAIAGTLAVLLQAALRGYIDFPDAMKQLRQFGFRASKPVATLMMARYEQAKKAKP